jgi:hypothetical protein
MNDDPSAVDVLYAKIEPGPEQEKYLIYYHMMLIITTSRIYQINSYQW